MKHTLILTLVGILLSPAATQAKEKPADGTAQVLSCYLLASEGRLRKGF